MLKHFTDQNPGVLGEEESDGKAHASHTEDVQVCDRVSAHTDTDTLANEGCISQHT